MNNTTQSPSDSQLVLQVPEPIESRVFRLILYAFVFFLTVGGNILVCIVVMKNKKLRSFQRFYYGYFLMSLAFADLAVALLCIPFTIVYYETGKWLFGEAICKMVPALSTLSVSTSIFTLTVMTYERYQAIVRPMKVQINKKKVFCMLAAAWICAFLTALPLIFVVKQKGDSSKVSHPCNEHWPKHTYRQMYTMFLFVGTYLVPLIVIFPAYVKMMFTLKNSHSFNLSDRKQRWKSLRVLIAVVIIFAVSYLPQHVMFITLDFGLANSNEYFEITLKYVYLLVWIASCSNPIIYGALDDYFRNGYRNILQRFIAVKKTGHQHATRLMSRGSSTYLRKTPGASPTGTPTNTAQRLLSVNSEYPPSSPTSDSTAISPGCESKSATAPLLRQDSSKLEQEENSKSS